jgi:NTP pyrophosphatase (non-canonical NTP hydrolase)
MGSWKHDAVALHRQIVKRWEPWSEEDVRFLAMGLAGEVGELLNIIKKDWRGDFNTPAKRGKLLDMLIEEFADVRIYLELLAIGCNLDLDTACELKMPELFRRWPEAAKKIKAGRCCAKHMNPTKKGCRGRNR